MENCTYQGKTLCTFDLKDGNGIYYEDMVIEWKQAAANRQLFCTDCASPVYLAAGPIKEPYFAHYDLKECEYDNSKESEELKKGKRLLYQLLKRSFPEGNISARHRMENGLYSTLYCLLEDGTKLAVDYRLQNNSLKSFQLRDSFYKTSGIIPLYVMGVRKKQEIGQIDWYQTLLQKSMGYLIFLDTVKEEVTLKQSFGYRLGKERHFKFCRCVYMIKELTIAADGSMICDFADQCKQIMKEIEEEKLRYQKRQQRLLELQQENESYQELETRRQEAYYEANRNKSTNQNQSSIRNLTSDQNQASNQNQSLNQNLISNQIMHSDLNPALLEKCRKLIEEGNAHLVSKKYYDAIMSERT